MIIFQIILSIFVIGLILIQPGGKGISRSFSSSNSFSKRGLEKLVFKSTFVFAFIFLVVSIISLGF